MTDFKVELYDAINKETWNKFTKKSNQSTFLFQRDFMDYHSDRFHDFSLMVFKKKRLLGLFPANIIDDTVCSHQGLTYGGLIHSKHLTTTDYIESLKSILFFLQSNGINTLYLKELPRPYLINQNNNPLYYFLFKTKAKTDKVDMHSIIDMNYKSYSRSRKEGVKRGVRSNLRVEESNSFDDFWNSILIPNLRTKHNVEPVHSLEDIQLLKSRFPSRIRLFKVFHNDKVVGGTTIFESSEVAHCQYISGDANKNKLGSLDFLHHHLLEHVFQNKPYFSFGTSNVRAGKHINGGLQFWKEGFGARSITQGFYLIKTKNFKQLEDVLI